MSIRNRPVSYRHHSSIADRNLRSERNDAISQSPKTRIQLTRITRIRQCLRIKFISQARRRHATTKHPTHHRSAACAATLFSSWTGCLQEHLHRTDTRGGGAPGAAAPPRPAAPDLHTGRVGAWVPPPLQLVRRDWIGEIWASIMTCNDTSSTMRTARVLLLLLAVRGVVVQAQPSPALNTCDGAYTRFNILNQ